MKVSHAIRDAACSCCEGRAKSKERTKLLDARKLYRDALAAKEALSEGTSSAMTLDDAIENNPYLKGLAERRRNGEISEDSFGQLWREAIRRIEEDFARGQNSISESKKLSGRDSEERIELEKEFSYEVFLWNSETVPIQRITIQLTLFAIAKSCMQTKKEPSGYLGR